MEINLYHIIDEKKDILFYVSQLCNRLFQNKSPAIIIAENKDMCIEIDKKLWSLNVEEFVPHDIYNKDIDYKEQDIILISDELMVNSPNEHYNLIIPDKFNDDLLGLLVKELNAISILYKKMYLFTKSKNLKLIDKLIEERFNVEINKYLQNIVNGSWDKIK